MAVVVGKQTSVSSVTSSQLSKIFLAETKKWPDGKDLVLVLHRASPGEETTLRHLNQMTAQQWRQWKAKHKDSIKLVDSDQDLLDVVETTPGAIGLVNVRSVNDRIIVVRVDGKLPLEEGYLSH